MPKNQTNELLREIRQLLEEQRSKKRPWWWNSRVWYLAAGLILLSLVQFDTDRYREADAIVSKGEPISLIPPDPEDLRMAFVMRSLQDGAEWSEAVRSVPSSRPSVGLFVKILERKTEKFSESVTIQTYETDPVFVTQLNSSGTHKIRVSVARSCIPEIGCDPDELRLRKIAVAKMSTLTIGTLRFPIRGFTNEEGRGSLVVEVLPPPGPERLLSNLERVYSLFF